ncbi:MAG: hypothetical protein KatS3mg105_0177 [Gemmatales bacterium]|nr:MAG: hypothetical protein KatS3mg105_0177 [Gemmatales bacterium]
MKEKQIYKRADEILGPFLQEHGFEIRQSGEYLRRVEGGEDRIAVGIGPPSKAATHFAVFMSYYPDYLNILATLHPKAAKNEEKGFPCGPYLTPVGATRNPKYWSHRTPEALDRSLAHVLECLKNAGLPWLETLRDPVVFAENIDPVAALGAAIAHEVAGNLEKAREFYEEMWRRLTIVRGMATEKKFLEESGRQFIFVATKLGKEPEKCAEYKEKLGFYPQIEPLGGNRDVGKVSRL